LNQSILMKIAITYFKLINRLKKIKKSARDSERKTSFPYLACDTYSSESSLSLDVQEDLDFIIESHEDKIPFRTIYINRSRLTQLRYTLAKNEYKIYSRKLIIGDSDQSIESRDLLPFCDYFDEIYATNLLSENVRLKILGIPTGLENKFYRSSGLVGSYRKIPNFQIENRNLGILVSWNDHTYLQYRSNVKRELSSSKNVKLVQQRVPFQIIHYLTRKSLIVACPRGNGVDTHRIWESLYLGAVPVITKYDYLPVFEKWPIHVINSWSELANMNRYDLEQIYGQYTNRLIAFRDQSKLFLKELFYG
jgi:hypothetical protein